MSIDSLEVVGEGQESAVQPNQSWLDFCGLVASIGCAIHCALMPFVIAYLPMLGLSWFADESFHVWMALVCFGIAICAFIPGFRTHKSYTPIMLGCIGIGVLVAHTFIAVDFSGTKAAGPIGEGTEAAAVCSCCNPGEDATFLQQLAPWMPPLGGVFLVSAHLVNHLKTKGCSCSSTCCNNQSRTVDLG